MDELPLSEPTPLTPSRGLSLVRRVAGPIWRRAGLTVVLVLPDRRTGKAIEVTLFLIEVDKTSYLLSQYGVSHWVRNLRAAGRGELRRKGQTEAFAAVEVGEDERDRVIAAFEAKVPRPFRRDHDRLPAAADHPTFRLEPIG